MSASSARPSPARPGRQVARMAAVVLVLEAFLLFFATLVAYRMTGLEPRTVFIGGGVLILVTLLTAAVVRRPGGLVLGWLVQIGILATGLLVPAMWLMGAVFLGLWIWLLWIGRTLDQPRPGPGE